jgi:hypothetical protein
MQDDHPTLGLDPADFAFDPDLWRTDGADPWFLQARCYDVPDWDERELSPAARDARMVEHRDLFHPAAAKERYGVDGRFLLLGMHPWVFRMGSAFYALYGHDKEGRWKGFVEVGLEPDPDEDALRRLHAVGCEVNDDTGA